MLKSSFIVKKKIIIVSIKSTLSVIFFFFKWFDKSIISSINSNQAWINRFASTDNKACYDLLSGLTEVTPAPILPMGRAVVTTATVACSMARDCSYTAKGPTTMEIWPFTVVRGAISIRIPKMYSCNVSSCCPLNCSTKLIFSLDPSVLKTEVHVVP